jgi:hypothetical protein
VRRSGACAREQGPHFRVHRVSSSPASVGVLARLSQAGPNAPDAHFRLTYQVVKHALVERPLELPALPQLLVVVIEALPVLAELCQAVLVHVVQSVLPVKNTFRSRRSSGSNFCISPSSPRVYVHAGCASCDLATLPQAVQLSPSVRLGLALHIVIVVGLAAGSNEEARAHKRCRGSSDFLDLGNRVRERSGVHEDLLVEPARKWSVNVPSIHSIGMGHTWVVWRPF